MSIEPNGSGLESWQVYRKLVLHELADIGDGLERIESRLSDLEQAVAGLKVKAGIWGLIAGAIPSIGALAILYLEKSP